MFCGITYGSQTCYMQDRDVLYSSGSFGQVGHSDLKSGVAVLFLQDWAVSAELEKSFATRDRALANIEHLRSDETLNRGRLY